MSIGRVRQQASLSSITEALNAAAANDSPTPKSAPRALLEPLGDILGARERPSFRLGLGAALMLILLSSLNLAALYATRARARRGEMAVRAALGAGSWQLARLLLTECSLLVALGGVVGTCLAVPALLMTLELIPEGYVFLKPPAVDGRVLAFAAAASALTILA